MADEIYVAKSYEGLEKVGEPYIINGKKYIKVRKGLTEKQVRVYTKAEYDSMYAQKADGPSTVRVNQKEVMGFGKGPIMIFKGDPSIDNEYFLLNPAYRYNCYWGWYVISGTAVPSDLPSEYTPIPLWWEEVGEGKHLKSKEEIQSKVASILHPESLTGDFQGEVGEKITTDMTVIKVIPIESRYGISNMYVMKDAKDNIYTWTTKAKQLDVGISYNITGKVKAHVTYKGQRQTVINYCQINA